MTSIKKFSIYKKRKRKEKPMTDVWDGFANLLAELIEKHAAELSYDDMPPPKETYPDVTNCNEHIDTKRNVDKINAIAI